MADAFSHNGISGKPAAKLAVCRAKTPVGVFTALYKNGSIVRVLFPDEPVSAQYDMVDDSLPFSQQMREYFNGRRREFSLPMVISGTPFMQAVYRAALTVPYGSTISYSALSQKAGYPRAMRAAGTALARINLPLLIPCHRVVHKTASKSAYRGGADIKSYLLDMEARYIKTGL